ncbi:hypothetical protein C8A05DRAFT_11386 [Staphylotrichum tortipilum]|uniref:Uncharacterized protein n=1 Tax=Staphylotrichum tortipilum TaxID=2831512 RepID=A0AAN6MTJ3_9PEZI|nr:hypothetical protein C8A05DRAFT_11386 [Staphylotrichum longicolle]
MPSSTDALKSTVETKGVKFHLKTGNAKWQCTILDRTTHEKQKAERERTDSASSIETTPSGSSSSSTKSH